MQASFFLEMRVVSDTTIWRYISLFTATFQGSSILWKLLEANLSKLLRVQKENCAQEGFGGD